MLASYTLHRTAFWLLELDCVLDDVEDETDEDDDEADELTDELDDALETLELDDTPFGDDVLSFPPPPPPQAAKASTDANSVKEIPLLMLRLIFLP
ncbi:hypothetical protein ACDA63_01565 [Uliginosibacterium sp. sgz301328]|uniref:hypothetical protein n=1 Tax=Uliginosibacterium sp. sgz301328 TaxID=3243764 RepID=UPI00359E9F83